MEKSEQQPNQAQCEQNTLKVLKSLHIDPKTIEDHPLEKILIDMIEILKIEVGIAMGNLQRCNECDANIAILRRLLSTAEELQDHLEFTLDAILHSDDAFRELLESKHSLTCKSHPGIKTKDDIAHVPTKYILMTFNQKLISEVQTLLRKCFREDARGNIEFVRSYENVSLITIMTKRFEIGCQHYPDTLSLSKDDIFNLPKSSPIWQDLHKSADFKAILTEQEADESYAKFQSLSNLGHIIIKNQIESKTLWSFKGMFGLVRDMLYYGTDAIKANTLAHLRTSTAEDASAFDLWNLPEQPIVSYALMMTTHAMVAFDEKIYVPRIFPKIDFDLIKEEYENGTFNKLHPIDKSEFEPFDYSHVRENVIEDLFRESDSKVGIRILAPKHLDIREGNNRMFKRVFHKASKVMKGSFFSKNDGMDGAIIIHIHGGGFVSMSSATHKVYLNNWVQNLNLVHFSIDYRLAPFNKYPDALDDVWQAYLWITTYAETVLGIKNQKVILVGDSAGGNLALALTLRLIRAGLPTPHACLLIYPALFISDKCSSPSLFGSLDDTLLPTALLKLAIKAYIPDGARATEDPFISPLVASDELLSKLPPVRINVGSKDPLYDDSWRLLARLKKLGKDVKMVVHEHIPHGFLNNADLKDKDAFNDHICEVIREAINVKY